MAKNNITIACFIVVLIANSVLGTTRYVPKEYANIQDAILACHDFDTVVIAPGRYTGPGNRNISLKGKAISVRSTDPTDSQAVKNTIIDCEGQSRGFVFNMGEKSDSMLSGLTITDGYGLLGGGIYCYNNSSPSITNCVINNNSAVIGGGLACANSNTKPKIINCNITANTALVGGGGCYFNASSPIIKNCIVSGNAAPDGGAFYSLYAGNPIIANCTISQNTASRSAGAVYCYEASNMAVTHSILWDNTAPYASEIKIGNSGAATSIQILYSNIQGGDENVIAENGCSVDWGQGNIDIDPNFVNLNPLSDNTIFTTGDYHLLDESPCIDAGDPDFVAEPSETDIDGDPRITGTKIDIGADEFASLAITAIVKVTPKTLNLQSSGKWINCTIQFQDEYSVGNVDNESIVINGQSKAVWCNTDQKANKLLVKFDRFENQQLLKDFEDSVQLTISGELIDGTSFEGSDTIRLLTKKGK